MKCPYCGAEVTPNTKCEYCDSFVERPPEKKEPERKAQERPPHMDYQHHRNPNMHNQTRNTAQNETSTQAENARIIKTIKTVIIAFFLSTFGIPLILTIIFGIISLIVTIPSGLFLLGLDWGDDTPPLSDIYSLSKVSGTVTNYHDDGTITIEYDYEDYNTSISDQTLVDWLEETGRTLDGYEVIFSTDSEGCISSIAMPSDMFCVIGQTDDTYLILRGDQVFTAKSDVRLELNSFYTGYISYPDITIRQVSYDNEYGYTLFDPECTNKEIATVTDQYSGEEILVPSVCIRNKWYYCTQELYDKCIVGEIVSEDLSYSSSMKLVFLE